MCAQLCFLSGFHGNGCELCMIMFQFLCDALNGQFGPVNRQFIVVTTGYWKLQTNQHHFSHVKPWENGDKGHRGGWKWS